MVVSHYNVSLRYVWNSEVMLPFFFEYVILVLDIIIWILFKRAQCFERLGLWGCRIEKQGHQCDGM